MPFTPLLEVVGSVGTLAPAQILSDGPKLNVGVITGLTVTLKFVVVAHCPGVGVNVYVPEFWLSTVDDDQVPLMPLPDVVGKLGTLPPAQIVREVPKLNVGVMFGFTITLKVVGLAHCEPLGVKV